LASSIDSLGRDVALTGAKDASRPHPAPTTSPTLRSKKPRQSGFAERDRLAPGPFQAVSAAHTLARVGGRTQGVDLD